MIIARSRRLRRSAHTLAIGLLLYAAALAAAPRILVLGDSLSAAYGMDESQGWVHLLQQRLAQEGFAGWQVVNASVSGETTDGGLARLPSLLSQHRPVLVVLELGGNDGLRALPLAGIRANLRTLIERSRTADAHVLLVGMRIPPNYGPTYTRGFEALYPELARTLRVPLAPFLLSGVAGDDTLMQSDGIHASPEAQPRLLENVWPHLEPLIRRSDVRPSGRRANHGGHGEDTESTERK